MPEVIVMYSLTSYCDKLNSSNVFKSCPCRIASGVLVIHAKLIHALTLEHTSTGRRGTVVPFHLKGARCMVDFKQLCCAIRRTTQDAMKSEELDD